ncbi:unnamed protein product [Ectocarpus sp. 4 AP-2014]
MGTAADRRPSVAFLTSLADNTSGSNTPAESSNQHDSLSTSASTLRAAPGYSESGSNSNSRVETLSRDSRRGRDVKSAEIDLVRYQPLPGSVRFASVTEKVLREAPFAVGNSKPMWRVFLTSRPFMELAADGFWFVVAHEILRMPVDAAHSPRFSRMAHVYSHMFTNAPPVFKDMWGSYFFEAWVLTLIILLQESFPKSKSLFDEPSFRMRLLDLCAEWTMGIRPSFPLAGHWVLKFDKRPPTELELLKRRTFGAGLSGTNSMPALPQGDGSKDRANGPTPTARRRGGIPEHRLFYVASRSAIDFGNSPFVKHHLRVLTGGGKTSVAPIRLQVTGEATRTLRPFQEQSLRLANDRLLRSNTWRAAQAVRVRNERPATVDILARIDQRREKLMRQHVSSKRETRQEISRMRIDAAEDRSSIETEAADLLSKGDVHEFSNFLVKHQAKKNCKAERKLLGSGSMGGGGGSLTGGGGGGGGEGEEERWKEMG